MRHRLVEMAVAAVAAAALLSGAAGPARAAGTITYQYDALGRLTSASYPNGSCLTYTYDPAGNRSQALSTSSPLPVANPVNLSAPENLATTFDPRISDPSCLALTVSAITAPSHGTASIVSGGVGIVYTPTTNYTGSDSFTYTISGGGHSSSPATVTVSVQAGFLGPTALQGAGVFQQSTPKGTCVTPVITTDVSSLMSDAYGYTLTVSHFTNGARGTVSSNGGTQLTYTYHTSVCTATLNDTDVYTYTISDPQGLTATASVSLQIQVLVF